MAVEHAPVLQHLSALKGGMDPREAAPQVAGVNFVKPLPHPGVRWCPCQAEKRAQVARLDRIAAAAHPRVELQQGRHLEREHREPRHQAVGKADAAGAERVGNAVEACAHGGKHSGHRQMPAEGISGHFTARLCLFCRRMPGSARKVYERKSVTVMQPIDNKQKEFLAGIAARTIGGSTSCTGKLNRPWPPETKKLGCTQDSDA